MSRLFPGLAALTRLHAAAVAPKRCFGTSRVASAPRVEFFSRTLTPLRVPPRSQPAPSALRARPVARWAPTAFTSSFLKRAFSSTPARAIRQQWYPQQSGPQPFWRKVKNRVDRMNPMHLVYGLIAINVAVFLLWQYAITSFQRFRDPKLLQFMWGNFIMSEVNIRAGRFWTLLTSCFSHKDGAHIFMNCLGLYFIAPAAVSLIGPAYFLALYLSGGLFSSLMSLAYQHAVTPPGQMRGSEGASGAIYTTLAFYATLFPTSTFLLFFIVPMPAWLLIGGIFSWDLFTAVSGRETRTDAAGHVGGMLAGLFAGLFTRRKLRLRRW